MNREEWLNKMTEELEPLLIEAGRPGAWKGALVGPP